MTLFSLLDPTSVSLHPDLTDIPDRDLTSSHQALFLQMSLPFTALLWLPTDTQVCPCQDRWVGSLVLDLPMDIYSNPDWALALQLIFGTHHHHQTSVPLQIIIMGRCLHRPCHFIPLVHFLVGVRGPLGPLPPLPPDMRFPGPRNRITPPMDLPPGVPPPRVLPLPAHTGDGYGQGAPSNPQNSVGLQSGPGQDVHLKQEAPQDSVRPGMV
ncbi:hypothetical protein GOODEAATRI_000340 [Goodea atripinnis]|uniref:Uncharacterized protein n=1 Tax=Goodea atripinnis TaxID=208336 RepID=A0ABV0MEX7_9TELE